MSHKKFTNDELKLAITYCLFQNNNDLWVAVKECVDNPSYYLFLYYYEQLKESPNHFNIKLPKIKYKLTKDFCLELLNDMILNYELYDKNMELIPLFNISIVDLINLYDIPDDLINGILFWYHNLSIITIDTIIDNNKKELIKKYQQQNIKNIKNINYNLCIILVQFIVIINFFIKYII